MGVHYYLSMIPESLVASMLGPEEFGSYLATGTRKRPHGQAMFFQLGEDLQSDHFDLANVPSRCVPHADREPKRSVYVAIYRVLEHVPLEAIGSLWLTSVHGQSLELKQADSPPEETDKHHLYQEICPVHPLIASSLGPASFCKRITDPAQPISVPKICFVDLELGKLADDPLHADAGKLPYPNIDHVRQCLMDLHEGKGKDTKTVDRVWRLSFLYRSVKSGFYVGDRQRMLYYPFPTQQELETKYYQWWRHASEAEPI